MATESLEIERKFLIKELPENLEQYPHTKMEQAYLCTSPVVRVRRDGDVYYMTYKGGGMMKRLEYNLPLTMESYTHLKEKADGILIEKTRYRIPLENNLTAELDIFSGKLKGLLLVEVEFPSEEAANAFIAPDWFGKDVTYDGHYHNSFLSEGFYQP